MVLITIGTWNLRLPLWRPMRPTACWVKQRWLKMSKIGLNCKLAYCGVMQNTWHDCGGRPQIAPSPLFAILLQNQDICVHAIQCFVVRGPYSLHPLAQSGQRLSKAWRISSMSSTILLHLPLLHQTQQQLLLGRTMREKLLSRTLLVRPAALRWRALWGTLVLLWMKMKHLLPPRSIQLTPPNLILWWWRRPHGPHAHGFQRRL